MSDKLKTAAGGTAGQAKRPHERVCVIGNLTTDVILRGVPALPGWGQEVMACDRSEVVAGQAGYLAFGAARLGLEPVVVSALGDDLDAERIRGALVDAAVGIAHVETIAGRVSPKTVAVVRPDGERAFISDFACLDVFDAAFVERHWEATRGASVVALAGTLNLPRLRHRELSDLLASARQAGALTLLDTGWDPGQWPAETIEDVLALLAEIDLFIPNLDEAAVLTGKDDPQEALGALAERCAGTVIIKGGAGGSWAAADASRIIHIPARPVAVDNAVGAGDVYNAAFIAGYLPQRDLVQAMTQATAAASFYIARGADRFPTREQVDALIAVVPGAPSR